MLEDSGFTSVTIGPSVDNFRGTAGEEQARAFDGYGYTFLAFKAPHVTHPRSGTERGGQIAARAEVARRAPQSSCTW
jgi:hypothetical protein